MAPPMMLRSSHGLACLAALMQCLAGIALAQTAATDGPANFQGLFLNPTGATETLSCSPSSIFAYSSTFAGCCSIGGNCNFATACSKGTPTNRLGGTWECEPRRTCYTMTVYGSYPSATDSWIVQGCANAWSASTVYRSLPLSMTATTSPSVSPVDSGTATTTGAASTAGSPGAPAESSTDGETSGESGNSQSLAWVAGVVIGCLAVAGLFAGFGFWLGRRRRRRRAEEEGAGRVFTAHSAAAVRSGQTGSPGDDDANWAGARAHAVVIADGVEVEGPMGEKGWARGPQELAGQGHVELEALPPQKGQYGYS